MMLKRFQVNPWSWDMLVVTQIRARSAAQTPQWHAL